MGPKVAHLRGYINRGRGRLKTLSLLLVTGTAHMNSSRPLLRAQALGRLRGSSNPNRDASSCMCGYLRGAASVAQG